MEKQLEKQLGHAIKNVYSLDEYLQAIKPRLKDALKDIKNFEWDMDKTENRGKLHWDVAWSKPENNPLSKANEQGLSLNNPVFFFDDQFWNQLATKTDGFLEDQRLDLKNNEREMKHPAALDLLHEQLFRELQEYSVNTIQGQILKDQLKLASTKMPRYTSETDLATYLTELEQFSQKFKTQCLELQKFQTDSKVLWSKFDQKYDRLIEEKFWQKGEKPEYNLFGR